MGRPITRALAKLQPTKGHGLSSTLNAEQLRLETQAEPGTQEARELDAADDRLPDPTTNSVSPRVSSGLSAVRQARVTTSGHKRPGLSAVLKKRTHAVGGVSGYGGNANIKPWTETSAIEPVSKRLRSASSTDSAKLFLKGDKVDPFVQRLMNCSAKISERRVQRMRRDGRVTLDKPETRPALTGSMMNLAPKPAPRRMTRASTADVERDKKMREED